MGLAGFARHGLALEGDLHALRADLLESSGEDRVPLSEWDNLALRIDRDPHGDLCTVGVGDLLEDRYGLCEFRALGERPPIYLNSAGWDTLEGQLWDGHVAARLLQPWQLEPMPHSFGGASSALGSAHRADHQRGLGGDTRRCGSSRAARLLEDLLREALAGSPCQLEQLGELLLEPAAFGRLRIVQLRKLPHAQAHLLRQGLLEGLAEVAPERDRLHRTPEGAGGGEPDLRDVLEETVGRVGRALHRLDGSVENGGALRLLLLELLEGYSLLPLVGLCQQLIEGDGLLLLG